MEEKIEVPVLDSLDFNVEKKTVNDTVSLKSGSFRIPAIANPTTGYEWSIADFDDMDTTVIKFDCKHIEKQANNEGVVMFGAPTNSFYEFNVQSVGSASIKFVYKRIWESKEAPIAEAVYNITVTE